MDINKFLKHVKDTLVKNKETLLQSPMAVANQQFQQKVAQPVTQALTKNFIYDKDTNRFFPSSPYYKSAEVTQTTNPQERLKKEIEFATGLAVAGMTGNVTSVVQRSSAPKILDAIAKHDELVRTGNIDDFVNGQLNQADDALRLLAEEKLSKKFAWGTKTKQTPIEQVKQELHNLAMIDAQDTGLLPKPSTGGEIKVYHGTNSDIKQFREPTFNIETQDTSSAFGKGIYTTDNPEYAKQFGQKVKEINIPKDAKFFDLKDTKYRLSDNEAKSINSAIKQLGIDKTLQTAEGYSSVKKGDLATVIFDDLRRNLNSGELTELMQKAGFDGVKYQEIPLQTAFGSNPKRWGDKTDYVIFSEKLANKGLPVSGGEIGKKPMTEFQLKNLLDASKLTER